MVVVSSTCGRARIAVAAALAAVAALTFAAPAGAASKPAAGALYEYGPSGRYLLDGQWLLKEDRLNAGLRHHYFRQRSTAGWAPINVPGVVNPTSQSNDNFVGEVVWYRHSFRLPSSAKGLVWLVRFESVNYHAQVWLNGKRVGRHDGSYLPFELNVSHAARRSGTNSLVVRVDSRRGTKDLPPSGFNSTSGLPTGGWWNYTGLNREVYLRKVNKVAFKTVKVTPSVPNPGAGPAQMSFDAAVTNYAKKAARVSISGSFGGQHVRLHGATVGSHATKTLHGSITVGSPHLWSPADPFLYPVSLRMRAGGSTAGSWSLKSGIREVKVINGMLTLNGHVLNLRGVGLHEDSPTQGNALDNDKRAADLANVRDLGATIVRAHYPLHPFYYEQGDKLGILFWSEVPVYSVRSSELKHAAVRRFALDELGQNIANNASHASILNWSVGNELAFNPSSLVALYLRTAASEAHRLDRSRPVGIAILGYPLAGCQAAYDRFDLLGVNEYFGWYQGPNGQISDRDLLSPYLDSVHACYPNKALLVTEFGAEANRDGPVEEKGTFQFQEDFVNFHLALLAQKPYLSGALYWALQEFRVRPGWDGGNPRASSPLHTKGLITFAGAKKPAYYAAQRIFRSTPPLR